MALRATADDIDPRLAPRESLARMLDAMSALSREAAAAYIECRTAPCADQADLLVCLIGTAPVRGLSGSDDGTAADARGGRGDGWALADAVQAGRRTPHSGLHGVAPLVWLEFDDAGRCSTLPTPSVCVCVEPSYLQRDRLERRNAGCEATTSVVGRLAGVDEPTMAALVRCLRAMPAEGHTIHLSLMRARPGNATKLYQRVPLPAAAGYLEAIGWNGDDRRLGELLEWRRPTDRFVHLDVSIEGGRVLPRLGLAFPRDCDGRSFSHSIFAGLAAHCLTTTETDGFREAGDAWIRTETTVRAAGAGAHVVHRWIDQKIVFDRRGAELKLYLALRPLPCLFGGLSERG